MAITLTSLILDEISCAYFVLFMSLIWFLVIFLRLCFYSKDVQPTIFKKEKEVKFSLLTKDAELQFGIVGLSFAL